ncbi:mRNA surveillance protein pelota [Candidatus Woesearchaeota archaeon]|nr:mRNA surveillance protein pelota [Candidatus Woesearchaeota archaeon]
MKRINADFRKGNVKIKIENRDDLWYLSQVIEQGDLVSGRTIRKIKIRGEEDRKQKTAKKPVFIKIRTEKVELGQANLRVLGVIEGGPEDISRGEHHSFNVEEGTELSIEKEKWLNYQKDKLNEAFGSKISNILIVVFDREEAFFAMMKKYGYDILGHIEGNVAKKDVETKTSNFYNEIIGKLKEYDRRYKLDNIIMASPAFWKDELLKNLNDDSLRKKMVMATCSSAGKTAINEVLKRDEVKKVLASDRITSEINLVEELMKEIKAGGKASYGLKDVENAVNSGAAGILLVTDSLIERLRLENEYEKLDQLMKNADSMDAKVHIISSGHEGGKKLDGLGGIGAILRYRIDY